MTSLRMLWRLCAMAIIALSVRLYSRALSLDFMVIDTQQHMEEYLLASSLRSPSAAYDDAPDDGSIGQQQHTNNRPPSSRSRRYLRFDEACPKPIPGTARSHALPNAVPDFRTIPRSQAENLRYQRARRTDSDPSIADRAVGNMIRGDFNRSHDYGADHRALYLYNPSVLALHNTVVGSVGGDSGSNSDPNSNSGLNNNNDDPDLLSHDDLSSLTGNDPSVRYVVTYRANTGGNCFGADKKGLMKAGEQLSYLAVALLDDDLNVVPGTDVLIDLNAGPIRGRYPRYYKQKWQDCKVVLLRGTIYLLCNDFVQPVRIVRRNAGEKKSGSDNTSTGSNLEATHTGSDLAVPYVYPNIYGDGLEITLLDLPWNTASGKNFNLFRSPAAAATGAPTNSSAANSTSSTGPYDYYLQTYPLPHRYQRLTSDFKLRGTEQMSTVPIPPPSFDGPDTNNTILACPADDPGWKASGNCTQDPIEEPFFGDSDHGTSCCVYVDLGGSMGTVMVGISHTKLTLNLNPWWRRDVRGRYNHFRGKRYVHRFVAYHPSYPFDIVARSGWFCLGFADEVEGTERAGGGGNTLAGKNTEWSRLDLFDDTYDCPMIQFASGISDVVGNSSRVIIAYGVSDCHPRIMVVEKEQIAVRLRGD